MDVSRLPVAVHAGLLSIVAHRTIAV